MRNNYVLKLFDVESEIHTLGFYCTKSQIDKLFYALAFASASGGSVKCGYLYRIVRVPDCDFLTDELLENKFEIKESSDVSA